MKTTCAHATGDGGLKSQMFVWSSFDLKVARILFLAMRVSFETSFFIRATNERATTRETTTRVGLEFSGKKRFS